MNRKPSQPILDGSNSLANGLKCATIINENPVGAFTIGPTLFDSSRRKNDGIPVSGELVTSEFGPVFSANGSNSYIDLLDKPEFQITGSLSLAMHFFWKANVGTTYLVSKFAYSLFTVGDSPFFITRRAADDFFDETVFGPGDLIQNAWNSLVAVYDSHEQTSVLWLNGVAGAPVPKTDGSCGHLAGYNLYLARYSIFYASCIINGFYLWDRALNPQEIKRLNVDFFGAFRKN